MSVLRAFTVEFVDGYKVCEIEHVDFFKLAGCAEFWRHHVKRSINKRHDGGVALPDAGRFDKDHVKATDLARSDGIRQRL